jgi:hypothetical protein
MKNIKLTLTPAEAYITHAVLTQGFYAVYDDMKQQDSRSIITSEYVKQIIEPIIKQLEQQ